MPTLANPEKRAFEDVYTEAKRARYPDCSSMDLELPTVGAKRGWCQEDQDLRSVRHTPVSCFSSPTDAFDPNILRADGCDDAKAAQRATLLCSLGPACTELVRQAIPQCGIWSVLELLDTNSPHQPEQQERMNVFCRNIEMKSGGLFVQQFLKDAPATVLARVQAAYSGDDIGFLEVAVRTIFAAEATINVSVYQERLIQFDNSSSMETCEDRDPMNRITIVNAQPSNLFLIIPPLTFMQ